MTSLVWYIGPVMGVVITIATIVVMVKVFGGLHGAAKERNHLLQHGAAASGQIASVQQTGTYLNNQPQCIIQVQVYPQGGQPYTAQVTQVLSMVEIPQYQPGTQVQVRYDPQNPQRVAIMPKPPAMMAPGAPPPGYGAPPQGGFGAPPPGQPMAGGMAPMGAPPGAYPHAPQQVSAHAPQGYPNAGYAQPGPQGQPHHPQAHHPQAHGQAPPGGYPPGGYNNQGGQGWG